MPFGRLVLFFKQENTTIELFQSHKYDQRARAQERERNRFIDKAREKEQKNI